MKENLKANPTSEATECDLSVVVPVYNEVDSLLLLFERIESALSELSYAYEILFVDDGSTDGGLDVLRELAGKHEHVGLIALRRNFGKAKALDAAFAQVSGRIVCTMDADLQDDPNEIGKLLSRLESGYDLVCGWKVDRQDPAHKVFASRIFNRLLSWISGLDLHDFNTGFKVFYARTVEEVRLYGEMHRFLPVFVAAQGYRVTEQPVVHHAREFGVSKYGFERLPKGFFDLLTILLTTRFHSRPLHLFGLVGLGFGALGALILSYLSVLWVLDLGPIGTRPMFFLGILLVVVGLQFLCTGLLGEVMTRNNQQHQKVRGVEEMISARPKSSSTLLDKSSHSERLG